MEILDRQHQFNRYTPLVQLDNGNGLRLSFLNTEEDSVVLAKAQEIVDREVSLNEYNSIATLPFNILEHVQLLKEFVLKIKDTPNVTLTQYNNWLGTKEWYESAVIKYFVYMLATQLTTNAGMELTNLTETEILLKLRNWIVANSLRTIGKTIGYGSSNY